MSWVCLYSGQVSLWRTWWNPAQISDWTNIYFEDISLQKHYNYLPWDWILSSLNSDYVNLSSRFILLTFLVWSKMSIIIKYMKYEFFHIRSIIIFCCFSYLLFLKYELKNISFYRILRSQNIYHSTSRILRSKEYLSFKFVRHFRFSLLIYGQKMSVIKKNWNTTFVKFICCTQ